MVPAEPGIRWEQAVTEPRPMGHREIPPPVTALGTALGTAETKRRVAAHRTARAVVGVVR
jgi:hypothetical protein